MICSDAVLAATNSEPYDAVLTVSCSFQVPVNRSGVDEVQHCCD